MRAGGNDPDDEGVVHCHLVVKALAQLRPELVREIEASSEQPLGRLDELQDVLTLGARLV